MSDHSKTNSKIPSLYIPPLVIKQNKQEIPPFFPASIQTYSSSSLLEKRSLQHIEPIYHKTIEKRTLTSFKNSINSPSSDSKIVTKCNKKNANSLISPYSREPNCQNRGINYESLQFSEGLQMLKENNSLITMLQEQNQYINNFSSLEFGFSLKDQPMQAISQFNWLYKYQQKQNEEEIFIPKLKCFEDQTDVDSNQDETKIEPSDTQTKTSPQIKTEDSGLIKEEFREGEIPVLAEFTKAYPGWNLGTIFDYLQSGKPRDVFLREREAHSWRKGKTFKKVQKKTPEKLFSFDFVGQNINEIDSDLDSF